MPNMEIPRASLASQQVFPFSPRDSGYHETNDGRLNAICNVCGTRGDIVGFRVDDQRESGFCTACGSFCRQRQMMKVFRALTGQSESGPLDLPELFTVYNTESRRAVHDLLSRLPGYVCSEYFGPDIPSGPHIGAVRHEDLQHLSLPSGAFDIVMSSDVFEHIPDPYAAHREVFRVLKPGGRHIFTLPYHVGEPLDDVRAFAAGGHVTYLKEKIFHGDPVRPDEGVLVWTIPGLQMFIKLAEIGFRPAMYHLHDPQHAIIGPWSLVFVAEKPR
ncbi:methyltransferase family protein [Nitrospirillum amazonense]|uniref:Methyltransferase family protein n=1 Tax=Nitrospirillum amazonense TaxID=28077 RepID=A0A560FH38_9PROT|nr:class I SAM-dependent methyltransferase [Nitrospirillum amazonense]TWB20909.1 methyltransferase family protein [Nitrospirillum amazonense]